jgi:hypothetical protein
MIFTVNLSMIRTCTGVKLKDVTDLLPGMIAIVTD